PLSNPVERFGAKMNPRHTSKACHFRVLALTPQVRIALRRPAFAIAEIAYLRPRALYHRPRRRQSMTTGVNRRASLSVPMPPWACASCEKLASDGFAPYIPRG